MAASLLKRLLPFLASGILALALGFFLIPAPTAVTIVRHGGYFVVFAAFVGFLVSVARLVRRDHASFKFDQFHWRLAVLSFGIAVVWQFLGPHGFKILMDEVVLSATSMNLHANREVYLPLRGHNFNGLYMPLGGMVDKRPIFFPFLLSVVHDLTGYRSGNVFVLNGLLSFVCLYVTGLLGRLLGRQGNAGYLAVVLLAGLPLLIANATGGGFEILNVVMIASTLLLAIHYLRRPENHRLNPFILGTVLLAHTRYESAVFVAAAGIITVFGWFIARRVVISWGLISAPLLLSTIPMQNKVFSLNRGYWQLAENEEGPFRPEMVSDNLGHTVGYFFNLDGFRLASPVLSVIGLLCFLISIVYMLRRLRALRNEPETAAFGAFLLVVVANFVLVLTYYWGQLDDPVASRLGLPLLFSFALASSFVAGRKLNSSASWGILLSIPALWAFLAAIPISTRAETTTTYGSYREVKWQMEFIKQHRDQNCLFVLPSSLPAIVERQPSVPIEIIRERAEGLAFHMKEGTYLNVFVFQRFEFHPAIGESVVHKNSALPPEFVLETIEERMTQPLYSFRLSRVVGIDLSKRTPRPPDWQPKFPRAEQDVIGASNDPTDVYLKEFVDNLP